MDFPLVKSEELGKGFKVPNGTGMYKYVSSQGNNFVFEINKTYFGFIPKIKNIEMQSYNSAEDMYKSDADVILGFGDDTIKYAKKDGYKVSQYESSVVCAMVPSEKVNTQVRHFVNNAIDKKLVLRATMADYASVKNVLIPDGTYFVKNLSNTEGLKYKESKPESLRLIVDKNDEELMRMASVVNKQLAEKGVSCEVFQYTSQEFSNAVKTGEYDFAFVNYRMKKIPDFESYFSENEKNNINKFRDESIDSLIMSIKNAYSDKEISGVTDNNSLYSYVNNQTLKLYAKFVETLPIICLCSKHGTVTISEDVSGVNLYNFTFWNTMDITDWSVKESKN